MVAGSLNSTGDETVDETGRELCTYLTMVNLELQDDGSADATPQIRTHTLSLTLSLRVISGGLSRSRPQLSTELCPKLRHKLGTPVRDHIHREAMNAENVVQDNSGRQFGEGNKMGRLRETAHHSKDYHLAIRWRQA